MEVNKGTRIINFLIDFMVIYIFALIIVTPIQGNNFDLIFYLVYVVYYFILESIFGQTIGKLVTNTTVVTRYNSKPSVLKIGFRSLLRLNPFDSFSYLFGFEQGGHDLISGTRLKVKTK